MLKHRFQSGVSLIEVMVGLAILAMLMAFGVPQYGTFLANARLKATADTLVSGLSLARAEAVKRNARVEMVLISDDPEPALVNGYTTSVNGPNWVVRNWNAATGLWEFVEGRAGAEGSGSQTSTVRIDGTAVNASFNGFGGLNTGNTLIFDITNPSGGACDMWDRATRTRNPAARGPMRCLVVTVTPGGQIRTCDPAVDPLDLADTRRC